MSASQSREHSIMQGSALRDGCLLKPRVTNERATPSRGTRATNPLLISRPTVGNLLQDEKARVHIAFGHPYPDETGAKWDSKTHVDALLEECDVGFDGRKIMGRGRYVV